MKVIKKVFASNESTGSVVIEDYFTKEETIITMPADRFERFSRKLGKSEGQQVEVANGWIFLATNTQDNRQP